MLKLNPNLKLQAEELYKQFHSIRAVSTILGISYSSVYRMLLDGGFALRPRGRPPVKWPWKVKWYSEAYKWFSEHKDVRVPHNVQKIVELTGLKKYQIDYFLYIRKKICMEYLKSLKQLNELDIFLRAKFGEQVPTKYITSLVISLDKYNLDVHVEMLVFGQHHRIADMSWQEYISTVTGTSN